MKFQVDKMSADDWDQVRSIDQEGIETGNATFESEAPDWDMWNSNHIQDCRLVAKAGQTILGWAALSPVSGRCVYSGVAAVSVYVAINTGDLVLVDGCRRLSSKRRKKMGSRRWKQVFSPRISTASDYMNVTGSEKLVEERSSAR